VPDRSGAIHTCYVDHGRVIIVACPHPHNVVGGVAYRPVIPEVLGRACFDGSGTDEAGVARVTLRRCVAVEEQRAALAELEGTGGVVAQHVGHHIGYLLADNALALGDEVIDQLTLCVHHCVDGMWRNAHAAIGEHAEASGFVEQVNAQRAEHHSVVWRADIAGDAHLLCRVQCIINADPEENLHSRNVERVLQGIAYRQQAVIAPVVVMRCVGGQPAAHLNCEGSIQYWHAKPLAKAVA